MNSSVGPIFIIIAAILWAVDALIRTPLTRTIPAASIVLYEHVVGLLLLSPVFIKSLPVIKTLHLKTWAYVFLLALVSSIGGTLLFTQALGTSFATGDFITPLLLQKLQPVLVIVLSAIILKEKISKEFYPFAFLAVLGGYLMSFGFTLPTLNFSGKEEVVLLSLGAAFCWGVGTIISKTLLQTFSTRDATFLRFLAAVPIGIVVATITGQTFSPLSLTTEHLMRFAGIALSTGTVALFIYYFGLSRTKAHISTIAELVFPATSILIGITSLNPYGAPQSLSLIQIAGIFVLLLSVVRISFLLKKPRVVVKGIVVKGAGDGKKLGFPTANIATDTNVDLDYGVYACRIKFDDSDDKKKFEAILHYGPRLVFGEMKPLFEVHIFDFKKNIYGKNAVVTVGPFIRKTRNFSSVEKMVQQIEQDCIQAKAILSSHH